jgi:hypothetical protein
MKVLNGIACKLNWIEIQFNSTIGLIIESEKNRIQIGEESIENLHMNIIEIVFFSKNIN